MGYVLCCQWAIWIYPNILSDSGAIFVCHCAREEKSIVTITFVLSLTDWVLAGSTVVAKVMMLRKIWWSPIFGLAIQPIWILHSLVNEKFGFLITPICMSVIYGMCVKKWYQERYDHEFVEAHKDEFLIEEHDKHPDWKG